jgi:uncharacterized protein (TIGR04255 family)
MVSGQRSLPDFEDPPVVETALSVEFAPLAGWSIVHFGLFWHEIRAEYPAFEIQPPLLSQIEKFGEEAKKPQAINLQITNPMPVRCWFFDQSQTRLIQVQKDRLIYNWRKVAGPEPYPHYENIRPAFEREWHRFRQFLESNGLPAPTVHQCEVTYVNHIDRGKGWQTMADLPEVFPSWSGALSEGFLPVPEAVGFNTSYGMPGDQGRLHIQVQPAIRLSDAKEILQLTLTARGRPDSPDVGDVLKWFDLGREWVVRGFTDFTSPKMHALWKRKKGT